MTWFGIKCLKKGLYAVKQNNQPTNCDGKLKQKDPRMSNHSKA